MSENYFNPILTGESNSPDTVNSRLGDLDAAIFNQGITLENDIGSIQDALDAIIIEDGTGNAEVIAARTRIVYAPGTPPAILGDTIEYVGRGVANVLAFGADESGVANSSSAVQAALNTADSVYFPPGVYLFNSIVATGSNKTITGYGATLKCGAATPLSITGDRVVIEGLRFQGTATDHTTGTSDTSGECLYIDCTQSRADITVRNCHFSAASRGIWFLSPAAVNPALIIRNVSVTGCTFRDLKENGIAWRKTGAVRGSNFAVNDMRISNCHFEDCWFYPYVYMGAIYVGGGVTLHRLTITGCTAKNVMTAFVACTSSGAVEELSISGCHVSGERTFGAEANADKIKTQMGLDLSGVKYLSISACSFDFVREECIALYTVTQFAISGCTFRRGNVGISTNHDDYAAAGVGSRGVISGCTFTDMVDQSGSNVNKYCIAISDANSSAAAVRVAITGCRFDTGNTGGMTGIIIESLAHPDVQVSACTFNSMSRGIYLTGAFAQKIIIEGCRFEAATSRAIHCNGTLINSVIAHCIFEGNATDIEVATTTQVRCLGNSHFNTPGTALNLGNATMVTVANSLFHDVATVHGGTNHVGNPNNFVIWANNILAGTTTPHAINQGYITVNQQGQKTHLSGTAPAAGSWSVGDMAWDYTPAAGAFIGFICVTSGTPGTWRTFGAITP